MAKTMNLDEMSRELRKGLALFRALERAEEIVETAKQLEQATAEAEARKAKAVQDAEDATNSAAASIRDAEDRQVAAEEKLKAMRKEAQRVADETRELAEQHREQILTEANRQRADLEEQNRALGAEVDSKIAELKRLGERVAAAEATLVKFESVVQSIAAAGRKD